MSESSTEATTQQDSSDTASTEQSGDTTDWKAESRKWEQRAKENQRSAKELEKQHRASMTDADRALAEAEAKGRTAATADFGTRLARTAFDAAAGRRNPDFDTASALEYVDLSKFVGDDGEPDTQAIKAAVERLVPAPNGTPSFDGGSRSTAAGPIDMNQIIRKAAGRA